MVKKPLGCIVEAWAAFALGPGTSTALACCCATCWISKLTACPSNLPCNAGREVVRRRGAAPVW